MSAKRSRALDAAILIASSRRRGLTIAVARGRVLKLVSLGSPGCTGDAVAVERGDVPWSGESGSSDFRWG